MYSLLNLDKIGLRGFTHLSNTVQSTSTVEKNVLPSQQPEGYLGLERYEEGVLDTHKVNINQFSSQQRSKPTPVQ